MNGNEVISQNVIDSILNPELSDDIVQENDEKFKVDTLDKANWASRKIIQAENRIEERNMLAQQYRDKIDNWLEKANKEDERSVEFMKSLLRPYLEEEIHKKNTKTIKLLGVKISLWKTPERIEIVNFNLALSFCERHYPDTIITKKDLSKSEIKKIYQMGIPVPGVIITGGAERVIVKEDL